MSKLSVRVPLFAAALCVVMLGLASSATAQSHRAVDADGTLFSALAGSYGDLFPGGSDADAGTQVLALDIDRGDTSERLLVPGTATWRQERAPSLAIDDASGAVLLLWHATTASGETTAFFTSYRDGAFEALDQVRRGGAVVLFGATPSVVVTRDRFTLTAENGASSHVSRATFHLVWRDADDAVRYSFVSFIDGQFVGWTETLGLSPLIQQNHQQSTPPATGAGYSVLEVVPARDQRRLLVTLTEGTYHRLGVIEVGLLPLRLQHLGEELQDAMFAHADLYDPAEPTAFAEKIRGEIIDVGWKSHLNQAVSYYLADDISGWVDAQAATYGYDLVQLSQDARARALNAGSAVYATTAPDPQDAQSEILTLDLSDLLDDDGYRAELASVLDLDIRADLPAPTVDSAAPRVLASAEGSAIVAWEVDSAVVYRELGTDDLGEPIWSDQRRLELGAALATDEALDLLRTRLD
ncbi:MAG: hypothetical protein AAGN46_01655 [Acidobacteriota bacterium]